MSSESASSPPCLVTLGNRRVVERRDNYSITQQGYQGEPRKYNSLRHQAQITKAAGRDRALGFAKTEELAGGGTKQEVTGGALNEDP